MPTKHYNKPVGTFQGVGMMMKINRSKKMPVLCCSRCRSVVSIKKWVILEYLISNNDEIFCGDCEIACFIFDI